MIITIDGPIATGKSTIAKKLAHEIGFIHYDTGAMYRCLGYAIHQHNINPDDPVALDRFLDRFNFEIKVHNNEKVYYVDHEDVTLKIRSPEVTSYVAKIAAIPAVRKKLVGLQRECATGVNAVFEGRDLGTVVFPDASLKIFLTGRLDVRAVRRFEELCKKFPEQASTLTLDKVKADITARDAHDTQRETSPLQQAADAFVVDTSDLTIDEVVIKILDYRDSLKTKKRAT